MLHRFIGRPLRLLVVALIIVGFSQAAPASAGTESPRSTVATKLKAGCVGAACTGQDANAMGCGVDATTVDEFLATHPHSGRFVRVEMRQSRTCRARWLRTTSGEGSGGCTNNSYIRLLDLNANGVVTESRYVTFNLCEGQIITRMVGRAGNSDRSQFCYRADPYGWDSHPSYAPCKGQGWGAW